ncbi:hypothetical protein D3C84_124300 [compost metagenome]
MIRLEAGDLESMAAIFNLVTQQPQGSPFAAFQLTYRTIQQVAFRLLAVGLAEFLPPIRLALLHKGDQVLRIECSLFIVVRRLTHQPARSSQLLDNMVLKRLFPCFVIHCYSSHK